MKFSFSVIVCVFIAINCFSQETFTERKGSKFFPGHLHAVITVDSASIHYQLFNHWYTSAYTQYRDIKIPRNELGDFNSGNDTLSIILYGNKVKLFDKRYNLNRKVKHQKLCASLEAMRKISYAVSISDNHQNIRHFHLFVPDDLNLLEESFRKLVNENLREIKK
ncbi:hypothetical protein FUAX_11280 [Fulvitalea axinellae]|uniref:DUF4468 domain-containing protein n=1 Tax=Fulvitalea axinellae TaxID=1182444 RepID=A0AAU9D756_9BACT|nr:hypothetical protein FUAX_11280 [Fulvitalea axinellae]